MQFDKDSALTTVTRPSVLVITASLSDQGRGAAAGFDGADDSFTAEPEGRGAGCGVGTVAEAGTEDATFSCCGDGLLVPINPLCCSATTRPVTAVIVPAPAVKIPGTVRHHEPSDFVSWSKSLLVKCSICE
jgi:hypothetical protein